jgi:integrase
MARFKSGGKPKIVEMKVVYVLSGVQSAVFGPSKIKAEAKVPKGGRIVSLEPVKWKGYYWEGDKKRYVTASTEKGAAAMPTVTIGEAVPPIAAPKTVIFMGDDRDSLAGYAKVMLDTQIANRRIQRSAHTLYMSLISNHLAVPYAPGVPAIGSIPLTSITVEAIQEFLNAKTHAAQETGKGKSIVVELHGLLRKTWNYAMSDPALAGKVATISFDFRNDARAVAIDDMLVDHIHETPLTSEEIDKLIAACSDVYDRAMLGLALTGLRPPGEVLGSQWEDFDFEAGTRFVRNQIRNERQDDGKWKLVFKDRTKTGRHDPRRHTAIPISLKAMELILSTRELGSKWVVPSTRQNSKKHEHLGEAAGAMQPRTASYRWAAMMKRAGLAHRRFYITRHTVAEDLLKSGADLKTIQLIGGWSSARTIIDRYLRFDTARALEAFKSAGLLLDATVSHEDLVAKVMGATFEVKLRILTLLSTTPLAASAA